MWRTLSVTFLALALIIPFLFEVADAQQTDAFVAVVNEKTAEITGAVGSFREQLLTDHATIVAQNSKIAELTKQIETLKAAPPAAPGHHAPATEAPK